MLQCSKILRPLRVRRMPFFLLNRFVHSGKFQQGPRLFSLQLLITNYVFEQDSGLSPVLLTRARLLVSEHAKLTDQLASSFDAKVAKRAGELASVTSVLQEWEKANEVGNLHLNLRYRGIFL